MCILKIYLTLKLTANEESNTSSISIFSYTYYRKLNLSGLAFQYLSLPDFDVRIKKCCPPTPQYQVCFSMCKYLLSSIKMLLHLLW